MPIGPHASVGFNVEVLPPMSVIVEELGAIRNEIRSFREPFKRVIQEVMAPSIDTNFELGGRPTWEPLAEGTVEVRGSDSGILDLTGTLRDAAQQLSVWDIGHDSAQATQLPERAYYGGVHQSGSGLIPSRPFILMQPEDMEAAEEVFLEWIGERFKGHGFL